MGRNHNRSALLFGYVATLFVVLALFSCATKKDLSSQVDDLSSVKSGAAADEAVLNRVYSNAVTAGNVVANMKFSLEMNGKNISAPGSLHMRRDEIIRIQIFVPLLGTEVGRIDFTPGKVLLVDRLHKEYMEADYSQVGFLQRNNIDFYTLQSLFWDNLLIPGKKNVSQNQLERYALNGLKTAGRLDISLQDGNMNYEWSADRLTALIEQAVLSYESASKGKSTMTCTYGDFQRLDKKQFPMSIVFNVETGATGKQRKAKMSLKLTDLSSDSKWDSTTQLTGKYQKMQSSDLFDKLLRM